MNRFVISVLLLVVAVGVIAAGCGQALAPTVAPPPGKQQPVATKAVWEQKWEDLIAGARKEGKVVMYGEIGALLKDRLIQDFQNKYGVQIEFLTGRPPEVAQKYLQERAANLHLPDVFITGQTTTLTLLKPRGVLARVTPNLVLPEVLDTKAWPDGKLPFLDKDEMGVPLISAYRSYFVVNTELVKEGQFTEYKDLLEPRFKGKLTLIDPTTPGAGGTWVAYIMVKLMGREPGEKFMRQLETQELAITRDTRLHVETVARGKYAIAIGPLPQVVADLAAAGSPIAWAKTKEPGMVLTGSFAAAIPDQPPHPNAMALMLNHLLSKQGQLALSEAAGEPARRLDVPSTFALPGTIPPAGVNVVWLDEDFILKEPTFYPLSREILKIR
ncbi:MAG: extracellular solute-binding protein [Chloroflexi bacterium]|nr:extracellular solute-binding protein [Chloroflexota bacterium]